MGLSWAPFWCSWWLLGGSFGALGGSRWNPEFSKLFMWAPLSPLSWPPKSAQQPQTTPQAPYVHLKWLFFLSWNLLVSILSSQPDPPTLKNLDTSIGISTFVKINVWDLKMVLTMCWGSFGLLFGALRGLLGVLLVVLEPPSGSRKTLNL